MPHSFCALSASGRTGPYATGNAGGGTAAQEHFRCCRPFRNSLRDEERVPIVLPHRTPGIDRVPGRLGHGSRMLFPCRGRGVGDGFAARSSGNAGLCVRGLGPHPVVPSIIPRQGRGVVRLNRAETYANWGIRPRQTCGTHYASDGRQRRRRRQPRRTGGTNMLILCLGQRLAYRLIPWASVLVRRRCAGKRPSAGLLLARAAADRRTDDRQQRRPASTDGANAQQDRRKPADGRGRFDRGAPHQ